MAIAKPWSLIRMQNVGFNGASSRNFGKSGIHVLFSDESTFTVFPISRRVMMWGSPKEAYYTILIIFCGLKPCTSSQKIFDNPEICHYSFFGGVGGDGFGCQELVFFIVDKAQTFLE